MIRRAPHERGFTVVTNTLIEDSQLSWKALGLLMYLLSRPDGWTVNERQLAKQRSAGRDAVRAGLRELEAAGYLHRERIQTETGRFRWDSVIYESPRHSDGSTPWLGFPATGKPATDNPPLIRKEGEKTDRASGYLETDISPRNLPSNKKSAAACHGMKAARNAFDASPPTRGAVANPPAELSLIDTEPEVLRALTPETLMRRFRTEHRDLWPRLERIKERPDVRHPRQVQRLEALTILSELRDKRQSDAENADTPVLAKPEGYGKRLPGKLQRDMARANQSIAGGVA